MYYSDNPNADFDRWDEDQNKWLAQLPVCDDCGEAIQEDYYYEVDGKIFCPDCMERYRRVNG